MIAEGPKAHTGRRERLSVAKVAEALRAARGVQRYAATKLGCHRQTVANMVKRHPELAQLVDEEREGLLDTAEGKLLEAITRGEFPAIAFYLKCQGKNRGYVERGELTGAGGRPLVPAPDYSKLSDQELEQLAHIVSKLQGKPE